MTVILDYAFRVMRTAKKEIDEFDMKIEDNSPSWYVSAVKAKYEFMLRVYTEIHNFVFNIGEVNAIEKQGNFLELCWQEWNKRGGSIPETMEIVAERMA